MKTLLRIITLIVLLSSVSCKKIDEPKNLIDGGIAWTTWKNVYVVGHDEMHRVLDFVTEGVVDFYCESASSGAKSNESSGDYDYSNGNITFKHGGADYGMAGLNQREEYTLTGGTVSGNKMDVKVKVETYLVIGDSKTFLKETNQTFSFIKVDNQ